MGRILRRLKPSKRYLEQRSNRDDRNRKVAVITNVHSLSHKFCKVGARYGVNVLFSAPNNVAKVGAAVQRTIEASESSTGCRIRHVAKFVLCKIAVVYHIPLSCGRTYIGQTVQCVQVRLLEDNNSLEKKSTNFWPSTVLSVGVCRFFKCEAFLNEPQALWPFLSICLCLSVSL